MKKESFMLFTKEENIDPNFYYFSGLSKTSGVTAYLLVNKGRKTVLANALEYGEVRKRCNAVRIESREQMKEIMKKNLGRKIGVNYNYVSVNGMKNLRKMLKGRKFVDASQRFADVRGIKAKEEIRKIKNACRITSELFIHLEAAVKKGKTEMQIADEMGAEAKRLGAEGFSFPPIIAFGKNSAIPHHRTGKTRIGEGILLADMGVIYEGYCSDMTRMFSMGEPTKRQSDIYHIIYEAKEEATGALKAGTNARDIFEAGNSVIKKGLGTDMIHSIGHGIGIEVHDYPEGINEKSEFILKTNMCVAIEPAYYGKEGVRIEDCVAVEKGKARMFSRAPSKLTVL